jgi:hypothetical protein
MKRALLCSRIPSLLRRAHSPSGSEGLLALMVGLLRTCHRADSSEKWSFFSVHIRTFLMLIQSQLFHSFTKEVWWLEQDQFGG